MSYVLLCLANKVLVVGLFESNIGKIAPRNTVTHQTAGDSELTASCATENSEFDSRKGK